MRKSTGMMVVPAAASIEVSAPVLVIAPLMVESGVVIVPPRTCIMRPSSSHAVTVSMATSSPIVVMRAPGIEPLPNPAPCPRRTSSSGICVSFERYEGWGYRFSPSRDALPREPWAVLCFSTYVAIAEVGISR